MKNIETGVDKLVDLINQRTRVSIDDAAKALGMSKVVVQEWAEFLEEEKIISIEYKFSKTFLIQRKLSEKEVKTKQKEYSAEKDAFVRRVENSLKNLEKDSLGLNKLKDEFNSLKKEIGTEIDKVDKEVKELEKYEYLKNNLDKDIEKQSAEFRELLDRAHKDLDLHHKTHQDLLQELEIEKREVLVKESHLFSLEEKESELLKRIEEIVEISKELSKKVAKERGSLGGSEKRVRNLQNAVKEIEQNIIKKRSALQPMLNKAKQHEEQILKIQQEIVEKAREKTAAIKSQVQEGVKATTNFRTFFDKKNEVGNLIEKIETEKKELELAFKMLEKKALVFDLTNKKSIGRTHIKELEKELENTEKQRTVLKQDLKNLVGMIKG